MSVTLSSAQSGSKRGEKLVIMGDFTGKAAFLFRFGKEGGMAESDKALTCETLDFTECLTFLHFFENI